MQQEGPHAVHLPGLPSRADGPVPPVAGVQGEPVDGQALQAEGLDLLCKSCFTLLCNLRRRIIFPNATFPTVFLNYLPL